MSDDCPRCDSGGVTHIGRDDQGVLEVNVYVCDNCLLIFRVVTPESWFGKTGRREQ